MSKYILQMDMLSGLVMVDIGLWNKKRNAFSKGLIELTRTV